MKKLLSIVAIASTCAAFGATTVTTITVGQIGVTEIDSGTSNTIVAVSYDDLTGGNMVISNLVKTTNLTVGDQLIAYSGGKYETWELKEGTGGAKYWQAMDKCYTLSSNGLTQADGTPASGVTQAWGSGIWLSRQDCSESFYIYGKPNSSTSYTCPQGITLVGNPCQTNSVPKITGMWVGDKISIPANNGLGKITYTYSEYKKSGESNATAGWMCIDPSTHLPKIVSSLPAIPAGTGFWYNAYNVNSSPTIKWE